jgi:lactoylglutathione lyase
MRWTHFTLPVDNLDGSVRFFTEVCGLSLVRDRRVEGGNTVWLGPEPEAGQDPEFVLVAFTGEVVQPLDHFGFQCGSRAEVAAIAERAGNEGSLVEGPTDFGGSVGYFAVVRKPSGHLVEFTFGQPLRGLSSRATNPSIERTA